MADKVKRIVICLASTEVLRLSEERSHDDCCSGCLECFDECLAGLAGRVDVVDDQDTFSSEIFSVDVYIVLDVRRQLIVASDVRPLAATADLYAVEAIDGTCQLAQQL